MILKIGEKIPATGEITIEPYRKNPSIAKKTKKNHPQTDRFTIPILKNIRNLEKVNNLSSNDDIKPC